MCGFSARAVQALKMGGAREIFAVNVIDNDVLREGIKSYANWPTLPQVYIGGEFIGGCDITVEMYQEGELQKMIEAAETA
jgi:monothiol glutaredoxin